MSFFPTFSTVRSHLSKCSPSVSSCTKKNAKRLAYPWKFTIRHKTRFAMAYGWNGLIRNVLVLSQKAYTENGISTPWIDYSLIPLTNMHYAFANVPMGIMSRSVLRVSQGLFMNYTVDPEEIIT